MNQNGEKMGVMYASFSYLLWGLLPIYWKLLDGVGADEILASRIVWSFLFMVVILLITRKWSSFMVTLKGLFQNKKQLVFLTTASLLVSCNWFIYIWAVNHNQIIEASMGYYINPLVSVLLGMIVLKEKLTAAQYVSFFFAFVGVIILTVSYGMLPWISLSLAFTFGFYGLAKKMIKVDSSVGLTLETMVVTPIALIYILYLVSQGMNTFMTVSLKTDLLLILSGAATAIPLLYFAKGAQRIPLSMLGYIQYLAPTISLLLGIFVFGEHFSSSHFIAFSFIWFALLIYSLSNAKFLKRIKQKKESRVGA
ncbi:EamA family transporter RarD [Bacillus tuaregi]|uniref:EamA family transporter RarD n=1 Tax=Bacillus tuaregi TaxID=1816695 RepID=UPI0008F89EC5|nr:EamA family transporter RarD [Bacillus tuaregi]